jgi:hypothetical protein
VRWILAALALGLILFLSMIFSKADGLRLRESAPKLVGASESEVRKKLGDPFKVFEPPYYGFPLSSHSPKPTVPPTGRVLVFSEGAWVAYVYLNGESKVIHVFLAAT